MNSKSGLLPFILVLINFGKAQAVYNATISNYSYFARSPLVEIQHKDGNICSGVLIGRQMVLTAAHCIFPSTKVLAVRVVIPPSDVNSSLGYQIEIIAAKKFLIHDKYAKNVSDLSYENQLKNVKYDFGIIKLERPVSVTKVIANLIKSIDEKKLESYVSKLNLLVTGYGATNINGDNNYPSLGYGFFADSKSFYDDIQGKSIAAAFESDHFEVIALDGKKGASSCYGDSGGGLFLLNDSDLVNIKKYELPRKWDLLGINSWTLDSKGMPKSCFRGSIHPTVFRQEILDFILPNIL